MTFCSLLLEPDTSNVTVPSALLYSISTFLTWIAESCWQLVKPEVLRTSTASAPLVNAVAASAAPHNSDLAISEGCVDSPNQLVFPGWVCPSSSRKGFVPVLASCVLQFLRLFGCVLFAIRLVLCPSRKMIRSLLYVVSDLDSVSM